MRGKKFLCSVIVYLAAALLLPVLPVGENRGALSRKSILRSYSLRWGLKRFPQRAEMTTTVICRCAKKKRFRKSFAMPADGQKSLEIDDVWGSIEVIADVTDKVEMSVDRTTQAESKEKLELAKKEVTLDITQQEGALKLYVNGPFRCQCDDCRHSRDDDGYRVKMDFQVHVPRDIDIKVKTVNEGRVVVRDTNGSFLVRNVNGDIEMHDVAGSGTARTVNGPVIVSFRQNPKENSDFKTINGNVELKFAPDLSADFRFKTFNGASTAIFP